MLIINHYRDENLVCKVASSEGPNRAEFTLKVYHLTQSTMPVAIAQTFAMGVTSASFENLVDTAFEDFIRTSDYCLPED